MSIIGQSIAVYEMPDGGISLVDGTTANFLYLLFFITTIYIILDIYFQNLICSKYAIAYKDEHRCFEIIWRLH